MKDIIYATKFSWDIDKSSTFYSKHKPTDKQLKGKLKEIFGEKFLSAELKTNDNNEDAYNYFHCIINTTQHNQLSTLTNWYISVTKRDCKLNII